MKQNSSLKNKKVLITCGPTWIPIDDTRIISNISSGTLGHLISDQFIKAHAKVCLLEGPVLNPYQKKNAKIISFRYYKDLLKLLKLELKKTQYDIVIHAAAISDYQLKKQFTEKISSNRKHLKLELVPTKKIINEIKKINPKCILVGFKLASRMTRKDALEKTKKLFTDAKCDYVVANSTTQSTYNGFILNRNQEFRAQQKTRKGIAKALIKIL